MPQRGQAARSATLAALTNRIFACMSRPTCASRCHAALVPAIAATLLCANGAASAKASADAGGIKAPNGALSSPVLDLNMVCACDVPGRPQPMTSRRTR